MVNTSLESLIEHSLRILKSHIEFYRTGPTETHDEDYSSDELVCLAEHLEKKIRSIKPEENLQTNHIRKVFKTLTEIFPHKDPASLWTQSEQHVPRGGGDLDLAELIEDILLSTSR